MDQDNKLKNKQGLRSIPVFISHASWAPFPHCPPSPPLSLHKLGWKNLKLSRYMVQKPCANLFIICGPRGVAGRPGECRLLPGPKRRGRKRARRRGRKAWKAFDIKKISHTAGKGHSWRRCSGRCGELPVPRRQIRWPSRLEASLEVLCCPETPDAKDGGRSGRERQQQCRAVR